MSVRDGRKAPFIWAAVDTLAYLRSEWSAEAGVSVGHGLSTYFALTELANEDRARANTQATQSGQFSTKRADICERAGISDKPVDKAVRELERIGLLTVERSGARASGYVLHEADDVRCGVTPHLAEEPATEQVRSRSGETPHPGTEKLRTVSIKKKNSKKEEHTESESGRPKSKVGGKSVTDAEYLLADAIIAAFNAAAGTSVTVAAHLTPIVGRIREKPDLTADDHRGIIAAVFAVPWWDGAPGPNVIYGNAAQFERSIETWRAGPRRLKAVDSPAHRRSQEEYEESRRRHFESKGVKVA